jgi:DNA-binding NarL/FixJ family response regulator
VTIHLFVVDHPIVQNGVRHLADREPDIEVVGADTYDNTPWDGMSGVDVLLIDPHEYGESVAHAGEPFARRADLFMLAFSESREASWVAHILSAGARGYVGKYEPNSVLVNAIRTVGIGQRYVSPDLTGDLLLAHEVSMRARSLSSREDEVMRRLGSGETVTGVARHLALSPKTVSTYRSRILKKMGFRSTADIVRFVARRGMLVD